MIIAEGRRYVRIDTEAVLRGRKITSSYSYPAGTNIHEVLRINAALVRAYGNHGSRTIATPAETTSIR